MKMEPFLRLFNSDWSFFNSVCVVQWISAFKALEHCFTLFDSTGTQSAWLSSSLTELRKTNATIIHVNKYDWMLDPAFLVWRFLILEFRAECFILWHTHLQAVDAQTKPQVGYNHQCIPVRQHCASSLIHRSWTSHTTRVCAPMCGIVAVLCALYCKLIRRHWGCNCTPPCHAALFLW